MRNKYLLIALVLIVIIGIFALQELRKNNESTAKPNIKKDIVKPQLEDFAQNNFDENSINIDNDWFPLIPGTQWTYEGSTNEDGEEIPHRVIFTITDLTKMINGVRTVVAWDEDYAAESLVETELAFFAQDKDGNVWHLGQYPEEYEDGKLIAAPAWIAGEQDAQAGVSMKKDPQPKTPSYSQGWGPAVNWTDRAKVLEMGLKRCVPFGCYEDVLAIEETSEKEPNAFQLKYYARSVGNIAVGWKGKDATQETLELIDLKNLDPETMVIVRKKVMELEKRAYKISKDVYGHTQEIKQNPNVESQ